MNLFKSLSLPTLNPGQTLKNILIKYYGYESKLFLHQILEEWEKKGVRFATEVIANGLMVAGSFYWLFAWIRVVRHGDLFNFLDFILVLLSAGLFSKLFRETYRFIRSDWRRGEERGK